MTENERVFATINERQSNEEKRKRKSEKIFSFEILTKNQGKKYTFLNLSREGVFKEYFHHYEIVKLSQIYRKL